MTFDPGMPMVPEVALFILAVMVLFVGLLQRPARPSTIGWLTLIGLLITLGLAFVARDGQTLFGGSFVNDSLAIFSTVSYTHLTLPTILRV